MRIDSSLAASSATRKRAAHRGIACDEHDLLLRVAVAVRPCQRNAHIVRVAGIPVWPGACDIETRSPSRLLPC